MRNRTRSVAGLAAVLAGFTALPASASTVAYYTFEDGTNGGSIATAIDSSATPTNLTGFGSPLPTYSSAVPVANVPQTGAPNTLSAHFAASASNDVFDNNASSPLKGYNPTNFTIETWVRFDLFSTAFQTFIGRDDSGKPGQGVGATSLFYLSVAANNLGNTTDTSQPVRGAFRVECITASNTDIQANSAFVPVTNTWYHVAAVGDAAAGTLSLYVDGNLVASTTGFNGLFNPNPDTAWMLGRGQYNGAVADRFTGNLDEARFSDAALAPSQFLNALAVPEPAAAGLFGLGVLGLLRRRR